MLLVSGGHLGNNHKSYLQSTEIYDPEVGSWRAGAALPSKRNGPRAANIDGRILFFGINTLSRIEDSYKRPIYLHVTGGFDGMDELDTILEYNITADSFTQIGTMTQGRNWHAISVVRHEDFSKSCP